LSKPFDDNTLRSPEEAVEFVAEILESATEYAIIGTDRDGTIVLWNEGARRIYGYTSEDMVGKANFNILHTPEGVAAKRPERVLKGALEDGKWDGTLIQTRKNGRRVAASITATVRRDRAGDVAGFLLIAKDISHSVPLSEELKSSSELLLRRNRELAAVNTAIGTISRDPDLADVLQNITDAARELVHSRYGALGVADENGHIVQVITSGMAPEDRTAIGPLPVGHGLLGALVRDGKPFRIREIAKDPRSHGFPENHPRMTSRLGVPVVLKEKPVGGLYLSDKIGVGEFSPEDQDAIMLLAGHAAVAIENARLYGEVQAARDELRVRNEELEEQYRRVQDANRLKTEFLANMSHELRTPLNAIIGFSELMYDGRVGPMNAEHKEYLGDILNSGRHLHKIINDILDLSKVESGTVDFRPEPVNLRHLVAEACDTLGDLTAVKNIELNMEVASSVGPVVTDPARLRQILYNYLSNAIKFTVDGGSITVRVLAEDTEWFRVEVEDTGIGIRPEDNDRVFIEFQQVDTGSAKHYQGTGLGLALTKRIVEGQGGRVSVESELGKGSTFRAVLPRRLTKDATISQ